MSERPSTRWRTSASGRGRPPNGHHAKSRDESPRASPGKSAEPLPGDPTAGLPLKRIRELYREADAILNICGTQEFNDDLLTSDRILYIESDPGVEQIKVDQRVKATIKYLQVIRRPQTPLRPTSLGKRK